MIQTIFLLGVLACPPPEIRNPAVRDPADELTRVRRIYVDKLNGGDTAPQIRDLIIAALQASKLFLITENPDRADAVLRGSAEDLIYTEKFSSNDGISARANASLGRSGSGVNTRGGRSTGLTLSENESRHTEERKHEAIATVRLVNPDGDVIWSTTQESTGGKFRGASADVADKVAKQLAADLERARKERRLP